MDSLQPFLAHYGTPIVWIVGGFLFLAVSNIFVRIGSAVKVWITDIKW